MSKPIAEFSNGAGERRVPRTPNRSSCSPFAEHQQRRMKRNLEDVTVVEFQTLEKLMAAHQVPNPRVPSLIRWLGGVLLHGAAAGLVGGLIHLATGEGASVLIAMQENNLLACALFLFICAQIGASSALMLAGCLETDK